MDRDLVLSIDVGLKNLALCAFRPGPDIHGRDDRIQLWTVTSTLPGVEAVMDTMRDVGVVALLPRVKEVVIERQPAKNIKMTRLMYHLEMFFAMSGRFVHLADSRHKLSFAAASPWWPGSVPDNWSYYTRKKLSAQSTRAYLEGTEQSDAARAVFATSTKLDDLGDCLLQGLAYVHFVATLPVSKAQAKRSKVPAPRRPTAQQLASGKLAKSHAVFLVREAPGALDSETALLAACEAFKPLKKALIRHFGGVSPAFVALSAWQRESIGGANLGPVPGASAPVLAGSIQSEREEMTGVLSGGDQRCDGAVGETRGDA